MARLRGAGRAAREPKLPVDKSSSDNPGDGNSPAPTPPTVRSSLRPGLRPVKISGLNTARQSTTKGGRIKKTTAKTEKTKPTPVHKECIICVTTRRVGKAAGRGFKMIDGMCEHFQGICNVCIGRMIKEKIIARDLDDAVLGCPFTECEHVLDYHAVVQMIFKDTREEWNTALLNHHIRNSENYIACLNPECAKYFSVEDCQGKSSKSSKSGPGQKIACPYCEETMCLKCMRPWHESSCNEVNIEEEQKSLNAMKELGAKPCPRCGVNITKEGGCNHMHCKFCQHDFCFSCLAPYHPGMQHADDCVETRHNIMQDPRNWLPDAVFPDIAWFDATMGAAVELPQQAGQALPPRIVPQPNVAGEPQQFVPARGSLRIMQLIQRLGQVGGWPQVHPPRNNRGT